MGNVPGTNSCPVADVVTLVQSQAAACDNNEEEYLEKRQIKKFAFPNNWATVF